MSDLNIRFNPAGESCPWRVIPDDDPHAGYAVTVMTRIDGKPAGKTFSLDADGTVKKTVANHTGQYSAVTRPGASLSALHRIVGSFTESDVLVLAYLPAAGNDPYRIEPAKAMRAHLGLPEDARPTGLHIIDGQPTAARLKENFLPSRFMLLDRDIVKNAPAHLAAESRDDFWRQMTTLWPDLADAARLIVPSSSNRVAFADGANCFNAPSEHWYIELTGARWDEWDAIRKHLELRAAAHGMTFTVTSASGAKLLRSVMDFSVISIGREIFESAPAVGAGLTRLSAQSELIPGNKARAPALPVMSAATSTSPSTSTSTAPPAPPAKPVTTARNPAALEPLVLMVRRAVDGGKHVALNKAAYTAGGLVAAGVVTADEARSAMRNAIASHNVRSLPAAYETIDRAMRNGGMRPFQPDAPTDDVSADDASADSADLLGEKSDLAADLVRLRNADINNAYRTALAIARRYGWQSPRRRGFSELADAIGGALPDGVRPDAPARIQRVVAGMEAKARAAAMKPVAIDPAALAEAGIRYARIASLADVAARIKADPAALYLVKAAHGTGKTEMILKPLARGGCAVAVTNRVALVADLCQRLDLANYQRLRGWELESCNALGICLPSITNPKFADVLSRADSILIDEVSACLHELHTTAGTLKKQGPAATQTLVNVINNARVAVGVDADVSTSDALLLAARVSRPVTVLELPATATGATVEFADAAVMQQRLIDALADGQRCRVACDSSRNVTELAAMIRRRFPALNVVAIHSRPGDSTAGAGATIDLLSDINNAVGDVDVLIHSPTVESGVSLTVPHFQRSFGFYCGRSIAPAQFIQMLRRDRTSRHFEIGFSGAGMDSQPTSAALILAAMDAAHRRTLELATDETGSVIRIEPATAWDKAAVAYRAQTNEQRNAAIQMLLLQLEQRGFTVRPAADGARIDTDARTCAKQDAAAHYAAVVLSANVINHEERSELERRYQPSPDESAAMERYDAALENGVAVEALSPMDLQRWKHGRLRRQYRNYARLVGAATPTAAVEAAVEADGALAHRSRELATIEAVQTFFEALGLDRQTGAGDVDATVISDAYLNLAQSPVRAALETAGICRFNRTPKYPVRWLNDALAAFGLELEATDENQRQMRSYRVAADATLTKAGDLKMPGWDAMADIHRRRTADEPLADDSMADDSMADGANGRCDDKEEKIIEASAVLNVTHASDEDDFKRGIIERLMADGWERRNAAARANSDWLWRYGSPDVAGLWQMRKEEKHA